MDVEKYARDRKEVDEVFSSVKNYEQLYVALVPLLEKNNPVAIYEIGRLYEDGKGVPQDNRKALTNYLISDHLGMPEATYRLGVIFEFGKCGVSPPSHARAAELYKAASDVGHSGAQCQLGGLYERGRGVEQDESLAASYYRLASNGGSELGKYLLGDCYIRGLGVDQSLTEGMALLHEAAQLGSGDAQIMLALRYRHGDQLPRDYIKAYVYANLASKSALSQTDRDAAIELRDEIFARMSDPEKSTVVKSDNPF